MLTVSDAARALDIRSIDVLTIISSKRFRIEWERGPGGKVILNHESVRQIKAAVAKHPELLAEGRDRLRYAAPPDDGGQ